MEIVITWYNDTMQDQVISLFENEYKLERKHFQTLFQNFYFHPFQKNKCLLIVALDGSTVAGFQSFFYWPYIVSGKEVNSFQSGNSLVHPDYRGKGIFQKMLAFIDKENKTMGIDFLMGFPVDASLKNFIKDKWINNFNLRWYLKICNPFAFFNKDLVVVGGFKNGIEKSDEFFLENKIRLSNSGEFADWRKSYLDKTQYYSFVYEKGNEKIVFHLKKNKRKKIINELIIGNILINNNDAFKLIAPAFKQLISKVKMHFHFISMAVNEEADQKITQALQSLSFKKSKKSIYFIVKPFTNEGFVLDKKNWLLYRSDIDTW